MVNTKGLLAGKVALVTGAASGIGRATAIAMAKEGAHVLVVDRDDAGGEATVKAIVDDGREAKFFHADASRASQVKAAVDFAVISYGRLDIAHNNAGVLVSTSLLADDAEQSYDFAMDNNTRSVMLSMKYEIPQMLKQGGGVIVNTASQLGLVAGHMPGMSTWAYSASKHAVIGLTRSVAAEYASQGIRINAVCPGSVLTPMTTGLVNHPERAKATLAMYPIGRFAQPEELANAVLWLASDASSYMIGAAVAVDGGATAI